MQRCKSTIRSIFLTCTLYRYIFYMCTFLNCIVYICTFYIIILVTIHFSKPLSPPNITFVFMKSCLKTPKFYILQYSTCSFADYTCYKSTSVKSTCLKHCDALIWKLTETPEHRRAAPTFIYFYQIIYSPFYFRFQFLSGILMFIGGAAV